jgi:hypothetical protein
MTRDLETGALVKPDDNMVVEGPIGKRTYIIRQLPDYRRFVSMGCCIVREVIKR